VLEEEKEKEVRLSESLDNSEKSLDQQGVLIGEEEDHRYIIIIGGISIFLPRSSAEASACVAHEELMQEASEEEAIGTIFFKTNSACVAGAREEGEPIEIVIEEDKEKILKYSQEMKEE
jgi:hypothetical protein